MNETIFVNQLIQLKSNDDILHTERILWIDEGNIIAYVIKIEGDCNLPFKRKVSEIVELIHDESAIIISDDPWIDLRGEDKLKKSDIEKRDGVWEIISKIACGENEPSIYIRQKRGELIKHITEEYKVSDRVIYKYLRKYWKRGKNKNSLLPDYSNCGGEGKERTLSEKKLGRPRKYDVNGKGINVDEATKQIFREAIKEFYNKGQKNPLSTAYVLMLKKYYSNDYRYDNGVKKPIINPVDKLPTMTQFRNWYKKERDIKKEKSTRESPKKFELKYRAILGESTHEGNGPGALFQIDATVADVYLVSSFNNNWIIGRPVVYSVMDVFSRMVTGIYVGLEGPSWVGAMMAVANAATDKVRFCKEYGINITEDKWMSHHLPQEFLADRGEFEGKNVDGLISAFGIEISNTPPFRADWKGIIEQNFRVLNLHVKPFLPGFVNPDFKERGGKDYRLGAKVDLYHFTKIIIKCVLYHNNQHLMKDYERDDLMISDDVECIPTKIWQWGIVNRAGKLKVYPEDIVKLNLMPMDTARVTNRGIKFKNLHYGCDSAKKEQWFEKAKEKTWEVSISYDPRNMSNIYLREHNGKSFEKCFLLKPYMVYENKTLEDIDYYVEHKKLSHKQNLADETQAKSDLYADIQAIEKEASKETNKVQIPGQSKSSKIKGIRSNRRNEKERNRENEAFDLGKNELDDIAQIISFNKEEENSELTDNNHSKEIDLKKVNQNSLQDTNQEIVCEKSQENAMEILRRIQKEKLNEQTK